MPAPKQPPLRRIVTRGAGTDHLECGHIIDHRPGKVTRARCVTCLPLEERRAYLASRGVTP